MENNNECFDAMEKMKWGDCICHETTKHNCNGKCNPLGYYSAQWIHLQSALDTGSVTKMDCYDAIKLGYVPEFLLVRDSKYVRLV